MSDRGRPPWQMGPDDERALPPWGPAPAPREPADSTGELRLPRREIVPTRPPLAPQRELVRRDRYADHDRAEDAERPPRDWSSLTARAQGQQVTLAALALILASVLWKAAFISHFYFRQDDFWLMDIAVRSGLKWQYIGRVWSGQFIPGAYVIGWLLVKIAVYNWTVNVWVELALIAVASLAAWRLFRTLLGNRPAILIPLALYVLSPLTFESDSWWISAVETVPLQIAIFTSLEAHIRYVRTRRFRHAVVAAAWLAFGLFCFEKSAVIPLLLFAVTAAFLVRRRSLLVALRATAVDFWRAWALYVGVLGVYVIAFLIRLTGSGAKPTTPASAHLALTFAWSLIYHSFVPGLLGGPWHWSIAKGAAGGTAAPPQEVAWLALLVVAVVVVASLLTRRRAWRGWAILVGWLAVDDILPVVIGRVANFPSYAILLGTATRYVADTSAVLAIAVALIFWPVAAPEREDYESAGRRREFFDSASWRPAAVALGAVFVIGSVWTVSEYQLHTVVSARSYIANARAALAHVPVGTVVVDKPVPSDIMVPLYGPNSDTSVVLGPLAPPAARITWTSQPAGNVGSVRIFGPDGRLDAAAISGVTGQTPSVFADCLTSRHTRLVVPLPARSGLAPFVRVLRISYLASTPAAGGSVRVLYNGIAGDIPITGTANNFYMAVTGAAPEVTLQATLTAGSFCFEKAVAGYFIPLAGAGAPRA